MDSRFRGSDMIRLLSFPRKRESIRKSEGFFNLLKCVVYLNYNSSGGKVFDWKEDEIDLCSTCLKRVLVNSAFWAWVYGQESGVIKETIKSACRYQNG